MGWGLAQCCQASSTTIRWPERLLRQQLANQLDPLLDSFNSKGNECIYLGNGQLQIEEEQSSLTIYLISQVRPVKSRSRDLSHFLPTFHPLLTTSPTSAK